MEELGPVIEETVFEPMNIKLCEDLQTIEEAEIETSAHDSLVESEIK